MKSRAAKVLDPGSLKKLFTALDRYAEREAVVGYRTRAFAHLLADGALRSGAAVWLDIEEVLRDPESEQIEVLGKVTMRSTEATKYRPRTFDVGEAARAAIADYLQAARKAGWLADASQLRGPLFVARYLGKQQRLGQRAAIQAWHAFLEATPDLDRELQLDDLVLTGRARFAAASGGSPELLSQHADISEKAAVRYSEHLPSRPGSTSDVMARLDSKHKREPARPAPAAAPAAAPAPAPATPQPPADIVDQIRKLAELRDEKIISEKQFEAKKLELLARI